MQTNSQQIRKIGNAIVAVVDEYNNHVAMPATAKNNRRLEYRGFDLLSSGGPEIAFEAKVAFGISVHVYFYLYDCDNKGPRVRISPSWGKQTGGATLECVEEEYYAISQAMNVARRIQQIAFEGLIHLGRYKNWNDRQTMEAIADEVNRRIAG